MFTICYCCFIFIKKITINKAEFQTTLFAFERNRTCGYDEFSANIVRGFMKNCASVIFIFFKKLLIKMFFQNG